MLHFLYIMNAMITYEQKGRIAIKVESVYGIERTPASTNATKA